MLFICQCAWFAPFWGENKGKNASSLASWIYAVELVLTQCTSSDIHSVSFSQLQENISLGSFLATILFCF